MNVSDIMTLGTASVRPDASLAEAARMMNEFAISAVPVIDQDERLVGILTERDFFKDDRTHMFALPPGQRASMIADTYVGSVATPDPVVIAADASVEEAARKMEDYLVRRLPVVDHGKVVGLISRADLLRALVED